MNLNTSLKRNWKGVRSGRNDKDWAELMLYRKELEEEKQKIAEILQDVHPELMLRITYDVEIQTHSGTCVNPTSLNVIYDTYTKIVELPNAFQKCDTEVDYKRKTYIPRNNSLLQKLFSIETENCKKSTGYCGCVTRYTIRSAIVCVPLINSNTNEQYVWVTSCIA